MATTLAAHAGAETSGEPSSAALVAARELFREATKDVDAGHVEAALGKFKRVAAVKETAAVRFNIARCEESLGKLGTALADFETAAQEASADPKSGDVGKMARDRATEIRPRVPRLTLSAPKPTADLVVKVDGESQLNATLGVALPVDPGRHTIEAGSNGASFKKVVELREGQAETVLIEFALAAGTPPPPRAPDAPPSAPEPDQTTAPPNRTPAYIVLGVGGVLGVTSLAFLLLHNQAAGDLDKQKTIDCTLPEGRCPESARARLDPLQSASKRDEVLAIGFGAATAVALGVGAYLVLSPPGVAKSTRMRIVPAASGVAVVGKF